MRRITSYCYLLLVKVNCSYITDESVEHIIGFEFRGNANVKSWQVKQIQTITVCGNIEQDIAMAWVIFRSYSCYSPVGYEVVRN